jgi:hypothetical protein
VPIRGPLLAIAGEGDTAVPLGAVRDVVDRACRNGQQIVFRSYGFDAVIVGRTCATKAVCAIGRS